MNLRDELATILDDHQLSVEPVASDPGLRALCGGCGWQLDVYTTDSARWEHAAHIADLQIAYLRDNLAQHGDELGLTREFAVCVEDDGDVFLYGHRYLDRAIAQRESDEMTERFETFVGAAWTTDWSRADD